MLSANIEQPRQYARRLLNSHTYRTMDHLSSFIFRETRTAKKHLPPPPPPLMGGKHLSQFNGNVKLYFYNTVDKKTPTAKKGTNLAVGLSRTRVQETFSGGENKWSRNAFQLYGGRIIRFGVPQSWYAKPFSFNSRPLSPSYNLMTFDRVSRTI